jgi:hypothetical protein
MEEEPIIVEPIIEPVDIQIKLVKSPSKNVDNTIDDPNYWILVSLRNQRNSYLQLTDKYLLQDYPITPENLEIIKTYRDMLRNFININKDTIINGNTVILEPPPF